MKAVASVENIFNDDFFGDIVDTPKKALSSIKNDNALRVS